MNRIIVYLVIICCFILTVSNAHAWSYTSLTVANGTKGSVTKDSNGYYVAAWINAGTNIVLRYRNGTSYTQQNISETSGQLQSVSIAAGPNNSLCLAVSSVSSLSVSPYQQVTFRYKKGTLDANFSGLPWTILSNENFPLNPENALVWWNTETEEGYIYDIFGADYPYHWYDDPPITGLRFARGIGRIQVANSGPTVGNKFWFACGVAYYVDNYNTPDPNPYGYRYEEHQSLFYLDEEGGSQTKTPVFMTCEVANADNPPIDTCAFEFTGPGTASQYNDDCVLAYDRIDYQFNDWNKYFRSLHYGTVAQWSETYLPKIAYNGTSLFAAYYLTSDGKTHYKTCAPSNFSWGNSTIIANGFPFAAGFDSSNFYSVVGSEMDIVSLYRGSTYISEVNTDGGYILGDRVAVGLNKAVFLNRGIEGRQGSFTYHQSLMTN